MKWASENGASVEGFEMVNFKEEGFGLRATRDIKVSSNPFVQGALVCLDGAAARPQDVRAGVWACPDVGGEQAACSQHSTGCHLVSRLTRGLGEPGPGSRQPLPVCLPWEPRC